MSNRGGVAVCGECLIDFIPKTSHRIVPRGQNRSRIASIAKNISSKKIILPNYQACIGGSPLNTAVAISRLGTPTLMVSRLSQDSFGEAIVKHLSLNQVGIKQLVRGEEPTTIGFVIPQKQKQKQKQKVEQSGQEDFIFYAQNSADRMMRIKDLPLIPDSVGHLHFSSIALQMEPCGSTYEYLMKREFRRRTLSLDPNVRPLFIKDPGVYRERVERMAKMVGIFRASEPDLKYLYPRLSPESALRKILPRLRPPGIGVLTRGGEEVTVLYRSTPKCIEEIHSSVKRSKVVDTIGAGDSFTGAFLHFLHRHQLIGWNSNQSPPKQNFPLPDVLREALDFAIRAARINCSREGCDPAFSNELK